MNQIALMILVKFVTLPLREQTTQSDMLHKISKMYILQKQVFRMFVILHITTLLQAFDKLHLAPRFPKNTSSTRSTTIFGLCYESA